MLIVRLLIISVLLLGVASLAIQNSDQQVVIRFLGMESGHTHVLLVVIGSFLAGVVVTVVGASVKTLRIRRNLRSEQRQLTAMQQEIHDLRNAPIRELS